MKRKSSKEANLYEPQGFDSCQSPKYSIWPIASLLKDKVVYDPACGEKNLMRGITEYTKAHFVYGSDLLEGINFFDDSHLINECDVIVTNPPYSIKYHWIQRCYEIGKPFALLMPLETLGAKSGQTFFSEHGVNIVLMNKRINFKMPNKGWAGTAQFPVAWFTWNLGLTKEINYYNFPIWFRGDNIVKHL